MNAAYPQHGHTGAAQNTGPGTLREALSRRAANGQRLSLEAAVAQLVPLCIELAEIHADGYGFLLHPSSVAENADGALSLAREMATLMPTHLRDRACLAPETQPDQLNDARANVYAMGAILYELVTGESVGHGMRRPTQIVPSLPKALENLLGVTLIIDPARRPSDLRALAQSIHELVPPGTVPPPAQEPVIGYNDSQAFAVDVSLSLLPPEPAPSAAPVILYPTAAAVPAVNGYGVAVQAAEDKSAVSQIAQFAELKAQLESDTRPRYFVRKAGMDHGPFTAVELVRHIDGHAFIDEDGLLDSFDGRQAPIREWPQFAQFAEHAKRNRQLQQRQKDIVKVAAAEKSSTRGKTLIGLLVLLAILGTAGAWYSATSDERRDRVAIQGDESTSVETDGSLNIKGKKGKGRRRGSGSAGGIPTVSSGQSCEAAMDAYNEMKVMGEEGQADLTAGQYGRVLNGGSYFSQCGVPLSMTVNICAAVQNGRAVGVTVSTQPNDPKKEGCIASAVRGLSFPSHPKLDVTRTRFTGQ
jgi:hypothetical protein